ncbi:MAG: hypothetical protein ACI9TK_001265 [Flavobacteriaceae bacterium]|jgi:hypothetical protein|tara:strand:+ start:2756 stop:3214 length:459 start_codon:yes stop_codon:yes gene_type:complete
MIKSNKLLAISAFLFFTTVIQGQKSDLSLDAFVEQHQSFEENENGEITPINVIEINKILKFLVEQKFPNIARTRNIIWDSYTTFVSPFDKYHFHTFIIQVKMEGVERYKYVEVTYDPETKKANTEYTWNAEKEDFFIPEVEEEITEESSSNN